MGLLRSSRSLVNLAHPRDPAIATMFGMKKTSTGAHVTPATVMGFPAAYRAVRLLARTMATLPIGIFERKQDGSRRAATEHPLHYLLNVRPNAWMTAFGFKELMAGHLELRGNAYAEIKADGRGRVTDLIPLHPDRVTVHSGVLSPGLGETVWYEHSSRNGAPRVILWDEMLHFRGFSQDGLVGLSPVEVAREAFGLAIGNQDYAGKIIGNDATPNGILKTPKLMDKEAKKAFRKSWVEKHGAGDNRASPAILDEGMEWVAMGFKPVDAQFLEQRKFDITEIARIFDLPPHKLMDLERSTNNNIEHQGIEYVMDAVLPRAVNWEETIERDLFLASDTPRFYCEANVEGLMRGDSAARAAFYTALFNVGALRPNDIRRKENMDPVEGGDEAYIQLNMVPLRHAAKMLGAGSGDGEGEVTDANGARARALLSRMARRHDHFFVDAVGRGLKREIGAARRALEKAQGARSLTPFEDWMTEFYPEHEEIVSRYLESTIQAAGEALAVGLLAACRKSPDTEIPGLSEFLHNAAVLAGRAHAVRSTSELRRIVKETPAEGRAKALTELLDAWESGRAQPDGVKECNQLARQVGEFVYRALGLPTTTILPEAA